MINNIKFPVQLLGCILGHGLPTKEKEMMTAADAEELHTGGSSLPPQFYFQTHPGTVSAVSMTTSSFCALGNIRKSKQRSQIC